MKVLLANIPWKKDGKTGVRAGSRWPHIKDEPEDRYLPFPFFLAYATALLRRHNFDVVLIDAIAEGLSNEQFLDRLYKENIDLVLIETSTVSLRDDLDFIANIHPDIPVALCGPHAGIAEAEFLRQNKRIQYALKGEYEFTLLDLVKHLNNNGNLKNIRGLNFRTPDGEIVINPGQGVIHNLDELPWPYREDGLSTYHYHDTPGNIPSPSVQMLASRGCPFGCTFCLWPQVMYGGRSYRVRNIIDVINEMEYLVQEKGFKSIYFDDDTFNIDKARMLAFSREIKKRNREGRINVPWAMMARADLMDREMLEELCSAGLAAIKYGIESADQRIVNNSGKNLDLKKTETIIGITKELGIKTHLSFAFGLPGETKETVRKTIFYALHLDPASVQFSIATPFPGTEYFNEIENKGLLVSRDWSDYDGNYKSVIRTENLTAGELKEARDRAYLIWGQHCRRRGDYSLFNLWHKSLNYAELLGIKETLIRAVKYLEKRARLFIHTLLEGIYSKTTPYLYKIHAIKLPESPPVNISIPEEWRIFKQWFRQSKKRYLTSRLALIGIMDGSYAYTGPHLAQIDLTNDCNNNCVGCWCNSLLLRDKRMGPDEKKKFLPFDMVIRLIDDLHRMGTREIYIAGGGEPFKYPWIMEVLKIIKKKGFVCYINTNFTLLDEEIIRQIVEMDIDHFTISLWAGTPQTYARLHPNKEPSMFLHISEMLKLISSLKNNGKKKIHPYIKLYNVISNLNFQEIEEMIDFAWQTGSESVEFTVIDTIPGYTDCLLLSESQSKALVDKCVAIRNKAKVSPGDSTSLLLPYKGKDIVLFRFDQFLRRISNSASLDGEYDKGIIDSVPCYVGWVFTRILADGNVNACLKAHRLPIGSLYEKNFARIWNSARQCEFRRRTKTEKKDGPIFRMIGNDPSLKTGCYKSCDDLGRNQHIHNKLHGLRWPERLMIKTAASVFKTFRYARSAFRKQ